MKPVGEPPDAGNPHVRFDERGWETERCRMAQATAPILGLTHSSRMVWVVFSNTVAGPGFLAGDYFGASGEATVGAGLGANVLLGGSNRTLAFQPISLSGQTGLNLALGVAALQLGLPRQ
jgi:hypothetical protein